MPVQMQSFKKKACKIDRVLGRTISKHR